MSEINVKSLTIGSGLPKICIPIVANTDAEIISLLPTLDRQDIDLLEWRLDFMDASVSNEQLTNIGKAIMKALPSKPLLVTFRTKQEGGEREISADDYCNMYRCFAKEKAADMVDLELFFLDNKEQIKSFTKELQAEGLKVIFSNHDFQKTPEKAEIVKRLTKMQELGADIAKIAVMPNSSEDVLTLLSATNEMKEKHNDTPFVTMSMGGLGAISRVSGSIFGSAITFGALSKASAPGQIALDDLRNILSLFSV
ncbi:MAG: type I 3-dehydroquinate dehydratase [Lachnospiraceae bacterium]|nr:type I 3-dehydroquinate dehydratase [Lachnospiraceae bacterium]